MQSAPLGIGPASVATAITAANLARRQRLVPARNGPLTPTLTPWAKAAPQQARPIGAATRENDPQRAGDLQVCAAWGPEATTSYAAQAASDSTAGPSVSRPLSEPARASLQRATGAMRRCGWLAFWTQLTLSAVSGVILLFSVAFTSAAGPKPALYLTVAGILAGFLSTFWAYGYQRTAFRMREYLDGAESARIKKQTVLETVAKGIVINVAGMGATLLGIATLVGGLVAKTLANASVTAAEVAAGYNPVVALDVFLVQAAVNTLLAHFLSLICSLWLLNVIGEGRGLKFQRQQHIQRLREAEDSGNDILKMATGNGGGLRFG